MAKTQTTPADRFFAAKGSDYSQRVRTAAYEIRNSPSARYFTTEGAIFAEARKEVDARNERTQERNAWRIENDCDASDKAARDDFAAADKAAGWYS